VKYGKGAARLRPNFLFFNRLFSASCSPSFSSPFSVTVIAPRRGIAEDLGRAREDLTCEDLQSRDPRQNRSAQTRVGLFRAAVALALTLRVAFVSLPAKDALTFHSGGSDAPSYVLLAHNLLAHLGYTYAGQPTAVRPPGYPLLLASAMSIFGGKYILALRGLQFVLGILTVAICAATARQLFGKTAGKASLLIGLFLPTLIFTTAQVLTECLAAFLTAVFLHNLILQRERQDSVSAWRMAFAAGLASIVRFNAAALPLFAAFAILRGEKSRGEERSRSAHPDSANVSAHRGQRRGWKRLTVVRGGGKKPTPSKRLAIVLGVPLLIVSPWLIRNELAFHGEVLYSTQSGPNAVQGVLTSQGRTQPGDTGKLRSHLGWGLRDIETNSPARLTLPSEAELDRRALLLVPDLWSREGLYALALLGKKVSDFWLSLDQLTGTSSLPLSDRGMRFAGVLAYWGALLMAILGWRALRQTHARIAAVLLWYAAGFTLLHLPLVMNTRLRIPLLEPLLVMLAGAGWCSVVERWRSQRAASHASVAI
jgi:hypothetical protein